MAIVDDSLQQEVTPMRKVYKKPQIEKIKLVLEEAVLNGCKNQSPGVNGPDEGWCGYKWGVPGQCREFTS